MNYYLGEIIAFAGTYVPENFHLCDGSTLSVADNQALYSVIGNTYGGGTTNFNIPNLKGLVVVGVGKSNAGTQYTLGTKGGAPQVTLLQANLPAHTHNFLVSTANATTGDPKNNFLAASVPAEGSTFKEAKIYITGVTPNAELNDDTVSDMGGNQPHDNEQPYLTINYMICTRGLFPSPA